MHAVDQRIKTAEAACAKRCNAFINAGWLDCDKLDQAVHIYSLDLTAECLKHVLVT